MTEAINNIFENPFGLGFGGSGWVHADFIQLTANIGWIGGGVFVFMFLSQFIQSYLISQKKNILQKEKDDLVIIFMCNIAVGFHFSLNGIYFLPQTGVPFFLFMALGYYYSQKIRTNIARRDQINRSR